MNANNKQNEIIYNVRYLLNLVPEKKFRNNSEIYNHLNHIREYVESNGWIMTSPDGSYRAFNTFLKPKIGLGDDYIYGVLSAKKREEYTQWSILYYIRGKDSLDVKRNMDIDLYDDKSTPPPKVSIPNEMEIIFGFNHLFCPKNDKDDYRISRLPKNITDILGKMGGIDDSKRRDMLCNLIKFAILNSNINEGVDVNSHYRVDKDGHRYISTSFNTENLIQFLNFNKCKDDESGVLNEPPISYLYPICIQSPNVPDAAMIFRKKGRGKYTKFIGKTILNLSDARKDANLFIDGDTLESTWLNLENVENAEKAIDS